jgi:hypothetical protein
MFLVELLARFVIKYFKLNYIAMYANYLAHFLVALAIALGKMWQIRLCTGFTYMHKTATISYIKKVTC